MGGAYARTTGLDPAEAILTVAALDCSAWVAVSGLPWPALAHLLFSYFSRLTYTDRNDKRYARELLMSITTYLLIFNVFTMKISKPDSSAYTILSPNRPFSYG